MSFTLPANFVASTTQFMGDLVSGLGSYITLVIGVVLALVIVEIIIHALRPK